MIIKLFLKVFQLMEIGEVKMKLPWEGQEIIVSGIVLSVLCGLSHSISPENPET